MSGEVLKYSFKVWLTSGIVSFILYQIPLYYFYQDKLGLEGISYGALTSEIAIECLKAMGFLIVPWLFIIRCVRGLYQLDWSARGFRWVILLVSEFLTLFFLLDCICIVNINLLMPTAIMLAIFAVSNIIGVYLISPKVILSGMRARFMELE